MRYGIVAGTLAGLTLLAAGCSNVSSPVAPPPPIVLPTAPPPSPARPGRVYVVSPTAQSPMSWYTRSSSYTLYDDGTFSLDYPHVAYSGNYKVADGVVTFEWNGSSTGGPWEATGLLTDDSLMVRYGDIMLHSDFEDAAYVLVRP